MTNDPNLTAAVSMAKEVLAMVELIKRIQDALGTAETGEALVEVARNAHRAELELASYYNLGDDPFASIGEDY